MKRCGFTLVELLVVLAVGSILLTIAVPGYGFLVNTSRVAAVTNDLVGTLQLARSEAIKRGMRVTVCKTSNPGATPPACDATANWHEGWLVFVDGGARGAIDTSDFLLRVQARSPAGTIITANSYHDYISYRPSGMSQGSNKLGNGTFILCLEHIEKRVTVSMTGRIRLAKGNC